MKTIFEKLKKILKTIGIIIGLLSSVLTIVQSGKGDQEKNCEDNCCIEKILQIITKDKKGLQAINNNGRSLFLS